MADTPETIPTPAIGFSFLTNMPGDRQITMQCFVGSHEDDATINANFDRFWGIIDRQKARYEIESMTDELEKMVKALAQMEEDLVRVEADFAASQAALDAQVAPLLKQAEDAYTEGYGTHVGSGRRGDYKPSGQTKQLIDRAGQAKNDIVEQKAKNAAERDQHLATVEVNRNRYREAINEAEKKIEAKRRLIG